MPAHVKLCYSCAELMKEAYIVKELPTKYSSMSGGRVACEHCGKRVVMLSTYEVTLKRRGQNA